MNYLIVILKFRFYYVYVNKFVIEYIRIYHKMFGNIYDHVQSLKSAIILSVEQAGRISQVFTVLS